MTIETTKEDVAAVTTPEAKRPDCIPGACQPARWIGAEWQEGYHDPDCPNWSDE